MITTTTSSPTSQPTAEARQLEQAERRLLERYGVGADSRRLRLAGPALAVRVLETG